MTRRSALLFVAFCALLAGAFFGLLEPYSQEQEVPLRGEVARNPYLALGRLLEGMGLPVKAYAHLGQLRELPPTDGTLLLLGQRTYMTKERAQELRGWVERGGHLVLQTWSLWDDKTRRADLLLDPIGVRQFEAKTDWKRKIRARDEKNSAESGASDSERESDPDSESSYEAESVPEEASEEDSEETPLVEFPDGMTDTPPEKAPLAVREELIAHWEPEPGKVVRIDFNPIFFLKHEDGPEPVEVWTDRFGDHGYSIPLGAGHITVWTDDRFLQNDGIGELDHAEFAYRMVRLFGSDGATWIVTRDDQVRSLWDRVREDAWAVCVALAAWLVFYLWSIAPRFGPIQPDPAPERRELMEHVRASGNLDRKSVV